MLAEAEPQSLWILLARETLSGPLRKLMNLRAELPGSLKLIPQIGKPVLLGVVTAFRWGINQLLKTPQHYSPGRENKF